MLGRELATDLQKLPPMSLGIYRAVATSAPKHVLGFRYNRGAFFNALKVPIDVVHVYFLRLTAAAQTSRTLQSVCSGRSKVDKAVSNLKPSEHPTAIVSNPLKYGPLRGTAKAAVSSGSTRTSYARSLALISYQIKAKLFMADRRLLRSNIGWSLAGVGFRHRCFSAVSRSSIDASPFTLVP